MKLSRVVDSVFSAGLVLGLIIGYLGQRTRLCFIAGYRDFMMARDTTLLKGIPGKILTCAVLLPLTVVAAACQGPPPSGSTVGAMATPTPGAPTQTSAFTPVPTVEYVLSDLPRCPGMEQQSAFQFEWPDLENALEKLADYTWGYYRCALTPPDLVQFYRDQMLQPPYLWREVNHAEHHSGLVVLFYHPVKITWAYLWLLPGPDAQSSYLVISRSDPGEPQAWECRLLASPASASQGG